MQPIPGLRTRRASLDVGGSGADAAGTPLSGGGSLPASAGGWPRTWAAGSDWSARVGATSLTGSLRRTTHAAGPVTDARIEEAAEAEAEAEAAAAGSPLPRSGSGAAPGPSPQPGGARSRLRAGSGPLTANGDLEEALLLYDFDESLEDGEGEEEDEEQQQQPQPAAAGPDAADDAAAGGAERRRQSMGDVPARQRSWRAKMEGSGHRLGGSPGTWGSGGHSGSVGGGGGGGGEFADWEVAPLLGGGAAAAVGSPAGRGHSYLFTRRADSGPLTPPCGLRSPAPPDGAAGAGAGAAPHGAYRESFVVHVEAQPPTSSTLQTAFNACNLLCGVGLLTTPYALELSGWGALLLLALVGAIACTTGGMLARCMAQSKAASYPDIGGAAFGTPGRVLVACLLYMELLACTVDFIILEGDGLSALFPGASLSLLGLPLSAKQAMMLAAAAAVLPTVLMRDLSILSYLSVFGIFASLLLIVLVGCTARLTGFPAAAALPALTWRGLPTSAALFSFCFSGHAVFPSLYASLRCKRQFPYVLVASFALVTALYGSMAALGAAMFEGVSDNIVLDLKRAAPRALPPHVAMWVVVVNPLTKIALTLAPVAMALEELLPLRAPGRAFDLASAGLRTGLLATAVALALGCPFFGVVMSLIGAVFSMSISIVLPCVFYHRLCAPGPGGTAVCAAIAVFGVFAGAWSTADAGLGQPQPSTSGRGHRLHAAVVTPQCSAGGLQRPAARRPRDADGGGGSSGGGGGGGGGGPPPSINTPRPLSLGYSGPRLASRPDLGSISARQVLEAQGRVVFDDADARMAAFDAMEVSVTRGQHGGSEPGSSNGGDAEGSGSGDGSGWDAAEQRLESFNALRRPPHLLQRMKKARLNRPTPIQSAAIPLLQAGHDVLLAAPPGSGATAAYLVPLLQSLSRASRPRTRNRAYPPALVLAPSRELAQQVAGEAARLTEGGKLKVLCATGGADAAAQRLALRSGCDLLVATPGRLLDLVSRRAVVLYNLRWLVLEEAEALLAPGHDAAVREVVARRTGSGGGGTARAAALAAAAADADAGGGGGGGGASELSCTPLQTVLVASSACDAAALRAAAADVLRPGAFTVAGVLPGGAAASPAAPAARQRVVGVAGKLKPRALLRLLSDGAAPGGGALVCCASAAGADAVAAALAAAGVPAGVLHAGRSQVDRDEALQCFRFGVTRVLVASDLAARGLDLPDVTRLINYDPPADEVEYAKRLARLGRGAAGGAGAEGGATTLVSPEDAPRAAALARALRAAGAAAPEWLVEMAEQHARHEAGAFALDGADADGGDGGGDGGSGAGDGGGEQQAAGGRLFKLRRQPAAGARLGSYLPLPGPHGEQP
ncbi:hypothetical protein Rsub_09537 [Raphidocelis subcapitata]|uniref:RNA helicase n=1 Tax=Raphidocelis subcapitata TaxID=307507 RepID=A0A2V0PB25_9CHLO|nr:hypothetical protein Rsub_09537 [Raphidocelis subcapitata]|eukprot:GBF97064.1 hypothetical protein Rsub_09537 [Raphidocelis subcapitata]